MKYGLKENQDSPPDTDKTLATENSDSNNKIETVVEVKAVENAESTKIVDHTGHCNETAPESDKSIVPLPINETATEPNNSIVQLPINEPVNTEQITVNQIIPSPSEKSEICETLNVPTPIPVHTESYIQQTKCELSPMSCDVIITDDAATTLQESVMEVVFSDDMSEVDMKSKSPTPSDVDMIVSVVDGQDAFVTSRVNYILKNAPIVELSRYSWGANEQKYLRGCLFSPDGTCILTTVNTDGMHIIELPLSLYENESVNADRPLDILTTAVHVPEGGTVYDYCWYPFMNSTLPETCCFISTRQHEPLQLWDAFDGKLRCTYRGYDAVDEVEAALSVCFSIDGSQVIAGYKKTLKIFRTDVPGRDYTNFSIKSPASCLAINNTDANTIAIGSWNSFVTFHDVRSPKLTMTEKLVKHTGGVTLMKFSSDGNRLYTGARRDNKLLAWDVRNVTVPLFTFNRNVETNQKIYFDMSWSGEWLVSGDTNGTLHVYDIDYGTENGKFPDYQYQLHRDCCNGVSIHPTRPIFATSSGQHHFIGTDEDIALKSAEVQENSLIFWWCGSVMIRSVSLLLLLKSLNKNWKL